MKNSGLIQRLVRRTGWFCLALLVCVNAHSMTGGEPAVGPRASTLQVPTDAKVLFSFSSDSLTAYWPFVVGALSYKLYAGTSSGNYPYQIDVGPQNTFTVPLSTLGSGPFFVAVHATNGLNSVPIGPEVMVSEPATPLSLTTLDDKVTLTWNPLPGAEGYTLLYGNASGKYTGALPLGAQTSLNLSTAGLPNGIYYAVVSVKTAAGEQLSNEVRLMQNVVPIDDQSASSTPEAREALAKEFLKLTAEYLQVSILVNSVAMADRSRTGWQTWHDRIGLTVQALDLLVNDSAAASKRAEAKLKQLYPDLADGPDALAKASPLPKEGASITANDQSAGLRLLKTLANHLNAAGKKLQSKMNEAWVQNKVADFCSTMDGFSAQVVEITSSLGTSLGGAAAVQGGFVLLADAGVAFVVGTTSGAALAGTALIGAPMLIGGAVVMVAFGADTVHIVVKGEHSSVNDSAFFQNLKEGVSVVSLAAPASKYEHARDLTLYVVDKIETWRRGQAGGGTKVSMGNGEARVVDLEAGDYKRNDVYPILPGEYRDLNNQPFTVLPVQAPGGSDFLWQNLPEDAIFLPDEFTPLTLNWPNDSSTAGEACSTQDSTPEPTPGHVHPDGCTCCCDSGGVPNR